MQPKKKANPRTIRRGPPDNSHGSGCTYSVLGVHNHCTGIVAGRCPQSARDIQECPPGSDRSAPGTRCRRDDIPSPARPRRRCRLAGRISTRCRHTGSTVSGSRLLQPDQPYIVLAQVFCREPARVRPGEGANNAGAVRIGFDKKCGLNGCCCVWCVCFFHVFLYPVCYIRICDLICVNCDTIVCAIVSQFTHIRSHILIYENEHRNVCKKYTHHTQPQSPHFLSKTTLAGTQHF